MKIKNIELTSEQIKLLKKNYGFKIVDNFRYVPIAFRSKNESGEYILPKTLWPVFTLRGIDGIMSMDVQDEMANNIDYDTETNTIKGFKFKFGSATIANCKRGIIGIENFYDEEGNVIEFESKNGTISDSCIKKIKPDLMTELSNAIIERSVLTEEELLGLE
jgi:hypothetical protein